LNDKTVVLKENYMLTMD